jgi:dihydropteroate synthase
VVLTSTVSAPLLSLGPQHYDLATRALVVGMVGQRWDLNPSSAGGCALDGLLAAAEAQLQAGADLLEVAGTSPDGVEEVGEAEELDRVTVAVSALAERFEAPISVSTPWASVASASFEAGAVLGNDRSGFGDPGYLAAVAAAGASVVASGGRPGPRGPNPGSSDVLASVRALLVDATERALAAGIPADRVVVDAGLEREKSPGQALELLRSSEALAELGHPLMLSVSHATMLSLPLDLVTGERREALLAACALGVLHGCRLLRVQHVTAAVAVRDSLDAILGAP